MTDIQEKLLSIYSAAAIGITLFDSEGASAGFHIIKKLAEEALETCRQQEERKPLTLPTFWECMPKVGQGLASPLEQFIYDNEPEEDGEAEEFRDSLLKVLTAHGIKGE